MAQGSVRNQIRPEDLVECPWCCGHGAGPEPCVECGGLGQTLRHVRCMCGRQVRLDVVGVVLPGVYGCGRLACARDIEARYGTEARESSGQVASE